MSKTLCFPFNNVSGGSLLGDASNVLSLTWLKLIIGNGEGVLEKKNQNLKLNEGFEGAMASLCN